MRVENPPTFSVLVILPSRIGDAIMTSGVLRHIRDTYPGASITIATSAAAGALFAEVAGIRGVIPFERRPFKSHWLLLWARVFQRWDLLIDMRGSLISYLVPAHRRLVYRAASRKAPREHRVLVAARVVDRHDDPPGPLIAFGPDTGRRAHALLRGRGPFLALSSGASWPPRRWPAERFAEMAAALLTRNPHLAGGRAIVVGSPDDPPVAPLLRERLGPERVIDLIGVDLLTAFACLSRVRLFVGNDSGAMHLAATAGAPTLGLAGPSVEVETGPWGRATAVVRGLRLVEDIRRLRRTPGVAARYMEALDVPTVIGAATDLLASTAPLFADIASLADAHPECSVIPRRHGRRTRVPTVRRPQSG